MYEYTNGTTASARKTAKLAANMAACGRTKLSTATPSPPQNHSGPAKRWVRRQFSSSARAQGF